jgi:hypothetical protein
VIEFVEKKRFFGKRGQQYIAPVPHVIIDPCGSTLVGPNENELRFQIFSSILDIEFRTGDQGNRQTSTAYLTVDAFLFQLSHARPGRLLPPPLKPKPQGSNGTTTDNGYHSACQAGAFGISQS